MLTISAVLQSAGHDPGRGDGEGDETDREDRAARSRVVDGEDSAVGV